MKLRKYFVVIRERKLLSFGTICDMEVKSMMPTSGQTCPTNIMTHICLVSFKKAKYFSRIVFLSRGNREMFKTMG
jgi:hypothetical protein